MKKKIKIFLILLFIICLSASCNHKNGTEIINGANIIKIEGHSEKTYTAEIYIPENCKEGSVLYYFHGHSGNASSWRNDYGNLVVEADIAPAVISISFGSMWFLTKGGEKNEPIIDVDTFVTDIMKDLESRLNFKVSERYLWGFSMGAYNAALLTCYYPSLFKKVVLNAPSILMVSPYSPEEKISSYISEMEQKYLTITSKIKKILTGNSHIKTIILALGDFQKRRFPTEELWDRNDILQLAPNLEHFPETYISCGTKDGNSFYEGAKAFFRILKDKGMNITFESIDGGGHNSKDYKSIKQFLLF